MLKIRRTANGDVVLTVSGRLEGDNVGDLTALFQEERGGRPLVVDLKDVVLVDREIVRFLRTCEMEGVVLRNCPPFIRSWITRDSEAL